MVLGNGLKISSEIDAEIEDTIKIVDLADEYVIEDIGNSDTEKGENQIPQEILEIDLSSEADFKSSQIISTEHRPMHTFSKILDPTVLLSDEQMTPMGGLAGTVFFSYFRQYISPNTDNIVYQISLPSIKIPQRSINDVLDGSARDGHFNGGEGEDTISYENSTQRVSIKLVRSEGELNDSEFDTYESIENIIGTNFHHDALEGDNDDNKIWGRDGNDFLWALGGDDTLYGEEGNDSLEGHDGNDHLIGGIGNDNLHGGDGADIFYMSNGDYLNGFSDRIRDFDMFEGDVIDMSELLYLFNEATDSINDYIQITDDGTDSTLGVDVNGTGSYQAIALIEGVTGLTDEAALFSSGVIVS